MKEIYIWIENTAKHTMATDTWLWMGIHAFQWVSIGMRQWFLIARTYHTIDRTMCLVHRKYGLKMLIAHILGILSAFLALSLSPPFFLSLNLCAIFTLQFLVNTLFLCNHAFFCILWIDNRWLHDGYKFFARKQRYADNDDGDDEMQHDSAWWSSSFRKPSITLTILQKRHSERVFCSFQLM